jgi:hypothetical protein
MNVIYFLIFIALALFVIWSLMRSAIATGRRKQKLKHAGLGFVAFIIVGGFLIDANEKEARDQGFQSIDDRNDARRAGITDSALWKTHKAEKQKAVDEQQRIADAAAAREQAEADRLAREAEEKAARDAAAAAEAEKQAELKRAETEKFEAAMAEMKRLAEERRAREDEAQTEREEAARLAEEERENKKKAADCLLSVECIWDDQRIEIAVECRAALESLAKWDHEWIDNWMEPPFAPAGWASKENGTIRVWGNKLKLQNGFGAWKQVAYFCAYDPKTKKAVDASVVTD